jgi:hypothetical protein
MGKSNDCDNKLNSRARGMPTAIKKYSHHQIRNDNKM